MTHADSNNAVHECSGRALPGQSVRVRPDLVSLVCGPSLTTHYPKLGMSGIVPLRFVPIAHIPASIDHEGGEAGQGHNQDHGEHV